jgi:hypothetical protein
MSPSTTVITVMGMVITQALPAMKTGAGQTQGKWFCYQCKNKTKIAVRQFSGGQKCAFDCDS